MQGTAKSDASTDSFAHMLKQGALREKAERGAKAATQENKARKTSSETNDRPVQGQDRPGRQESKPALTGKLSLQLQQQNAAKKMADNKATDSSDPLAQDGHSVANEVLSGCAVDTSSGAALMSILMQMKTGAAGMPAQAAAREAQSQSSQEQDRQAQDQQANPDPSLLAPLPLSLSSLPAAQSNGLGASADKAGAGSVKGVQGSTQGSAATGSLEDEGSGVSAPTTGHLAFALRLNTSLDASMKDAVEAKQQSQNAPESNSATMIGTLAAQTVPSGALSAGSEKKEHSHSEANDPGAAFAMIDAASPANPSAPDVTVPQTNTPLASPAPELEDKTLEYSTNTVRNLQMQVVGEDNRRVDVRLMDRAGELRVSVKSGDTTLNKTLQNNMPDLTSRLQSAQYQTEVWMPTSATQSPASGESADERAGAQQRPGWVADLEGATRES